jgi:hypothetical protein
VASTSSELLYDSIDDLNAASAVDLVALTADAGHCLRRAFPALGQESMVPGDCAMSQRRRLPVFLEQAAANRDGVTVATQLQNLPAG